MIFSMNTDFKNLLTTFKWSSEMVLCHCYVESVNSVTFVISLLNSVLSHSLCKPFLQKQELVDVRKTLYRLLFMVACVIIWQSKLCFVWKKKQKISMFLLITCLPRGFTVYIQVAPCVAYQFRAWLFNLRAGRCRHLIPGRGTAISFDQVDNSLYNI